MEGYWPKNRSRLFSYLYHVSTDKKHHSKNPVVGAFLYNMKSTVQAQVFVSAKCKAMVTVMMECKKPWWGSVRWMMTDMLV